MHMYLTIFIVSILFLACDRSEKEYTILTGADQIVEDDFKVIANHRIGLITNHTATVRDKHIAEAIYESEAVELTALFAPEHGIRGNTPAGARIYDEVDEHTGVPIYSLYGEVRKPTPEMLEHVDILVYDLQDVGARFYTRLSIMGYAMQAAAEEGIPFLVLDRPNPLGGELVEGFVREDGYESFVGLYPIPIVYGLTIAELANMIKGEQMLDGLEKLDLRVIPMRGWTRSMQWADVGRKWNPPSPNIPDFETALIYHGACLLEGTIASEGRGTHEPFKVVGAPWIDREQLADDLNGRDIPGLKFEPVSFTPVSIDGMAVSPKFENEEVHGVRFIIIDAANVHPVEAGIHLLDAFLRQAPDKEKFFHKEGIKRLAGTSVLHQMLLDEKSPQEIIDSWGKSVEEFINVREKYLLY
jgi:uncharacterized protein YbbC (DUF1343 family)